MRIISQRATFMKRYHYYHHCSEAGWGIFCLWQQRHLQMSDGSLMMKKAWSGDSSAHLHHLSSAHDSLMTSSFRHNLGLNSLQKARFADKTCVLLLELVRTLILQRSFCFLGEMAHMLYTASYLLFFFPINGWKARGKWHSLNATVHSFNCEIRGRWKTTYNFWRKLLKWSPRTPVVTHSIKMKKI